ncbi:MAG: hypothetical protein IKQ87_00935 [Clostridia bacterium]|nr:hypothetical protein [Clostridia bacterium]
MAEFVEFEGECPYCGQEVMGEGDARMICSCMDARKYRKILDALERFSERANPMPPIDEGVMDGLKVFAHLICDEAIESVTAKLADRTEVVIGAKVRRRAQLKVEEKVDG